MAKPPSPPQKQPELDADSGATVLFSSGFYLSSQSHRSHQTHDKLVTSNPYRAFAIDSVGSLTNLDLLQEHDSVDDVPKERRTG
jgi:hypothetical protein